MPKTTLRGGGGRIYLTYMSQFYYIPYFVSGNLCFKTWSKSNLYQNCEVRKKNSLSDLILCWHNFQIKWRREQYYSTVHSAVWTYYFRNTSVNASWPKIPYLEIYWISVLWYHRNSFRKALRSTVLLLTEPELRWLVFMVQLWVLTVMLVEIKGQKS